MGTIFFASVAIGIAILALAVWCVWQLIADKRFERQNQPAILAEMEASRDTSSRSDGIGLDVSELSGMERKLIESGISIPPVTFFALLAGSAFVLFLVGFAFYGLLGGLAAAAAGLIVVKLIVGRKTKKRTELFEKQLTQAEMQIAENLRSGLSVARSLRTVSEQTQDPLKRQFEAVYNEITYSSTTLPQALSNMATRTANKDVELLATVIKVQDETGSDLSDSLEFLSDTLSKRTEMRNSVKVALSEIKMTIKIVAAMPIAAFAAVMAFYSGYAEFYQSPTGIAMLVVCAAIELIALWILGRMSNVKLD